MSHCCWHGGRLIGAKRARAPVECLRLIQVSQGLANDTEVECGIGMAGSKAQHGAEMVLRFNQGIQRVHRDAKIVQRLDIVRIKTEGFAFTLDRFLRPPILQHGEADISP